MNILNPTRGQLLDRLSILDLKLDHIFDKHSPQRRAFLDEHEAIVDKLDLVDHPYGLADYKRLKTINSKLWDLQEQVAAQSGMPAPPQTLIGVELFRLNQERIEVIEAIDKAAGQYTGGEKVGY